LCFVYASLKYLSALRPRVKLRGDKYIDIDIDIDIDIYIPYIYRSSTGSLTS
jgi:hypothetical protein